MNNTTEIHKNIAEEFARFIFESPNLTNKIQQIIANGTGSDSMVGFHASERPAGHDIDREVRGLEVRFENDSTIMIKAHNKPRIPYDCRQLGFRDHRAKAWQFLIEVITEPEHTFNFGTAYLYPEGRASVRVKNKSYDARWKLCHEACKKLIRFFEKEFGWIFPKDYKLYERVATGPEGTKWFKFKVKNQVVDGIHPDNSERFLEEAGLAYEALEELELISEINRLNNDFLINSDDNLRAPDQLAMAFKFGQKRFGWSDEKMRAILSG